MEEILASIRQIISEDGEGGDAGADKPDTSGKKARRADAAETAASGAGEDASGAMTDEQDMEARAEADLAKAKDAFFADDDSAEAGGDTPDAAALSEGEAGDGDTQSETTDGPDDSVADVFAAQDDTVPDVEESKSMAMPAENKQQSPAPSGDDSLLSDDSHEVVHGAFSALAHTILAQNARTLEDLVSEMLQPMLKGWLDDNLPALVERLVKEEIDRVSRGRR